MSEGDQQTGAGRGQSGAVTVEAALIMLPTMLLIYGLFEFVFVFMVGISMQSAALEAAHSATVPAGKTVGDVLLEARRGMYLDFATGCLNLSVAEYDAADVPAALTTLGGDTTAFHASGGFAAADRVLTADSATLGGGSARLGVITVTCNWQTPFLTEFFNSSVPFRAYAIVPYES